MKDNYSYEIEEIERGKKFVLSSSRTRLIQIFMLILVLLFFGFAILILINKQELDNPVLITVCVSTFFMLVTFGLSTLKIKKEKFTSRSFFSKHTFHPQDIVSSSSFKIALFDPLKFNRFTSITFLNANNKEKTIYVLTKSIISIDHVKDVDIFLIKLKYTYLKKENKSFDK